MGGLIYVYHTRIAFFNVAIKTDLSKASAKSQFSNFETFVSKTKKRTEACLNFEL